MSTEHDVDGQRFEWDKEKAEINILVHDGVTFFEAASVFTDARAILIDDDDHSWDERRYIILGRSNQGRILFVSYTERGDVLRIISAREAEYYESNEYFEQDV